jgi:hypothetical protein
MSRTSNARKIGLWAGGITLLIITALIIFGVTYTQDPIAIPQEKIQKAINKKLPLEKKKFLMGIVVQEAKLKLHDNRIWLDYKVAVHRNGKLLADISASTNGEPVYRDKAFYLQHADFKVNSFRKGAKLERGLEIATNVGKKVKTKLFSKLKKWGVNLKKSEKAAFDEGKIKTCAVNHLKRSAQNTLNQTPVYRLKDNKSGLIIGAALQDIKVEPGKLMVKVSFWNLAWSVLCALMIGLLILLTVVALIGVTIVCPDWLEVFTFLDF